jgi:hypothetical protein
MAASSLLCDAKTTLQSQHEQGSFETYGDNMTPKDALPSHASYDTDDDNIERIPEVDGGPDQPITVAMLAIEFVENIKVRNQSLDTSGVLETESYSSRYDYYSQLLTSQSLGSVARLTRPHPSLERSESSNRAPSQSEKPYQPFQRPSAATMI